MLRGCSGDASGVSAIQFDRALLSFVRFGNRTNSVSTERNPDTARSSSRTQGKVARQSNDRAGQCIARLTLLENLRVLMLLDAPACSDKCTCVFLLPDQPESVFHMCFEVSA